MRLFTLPLALVILTASCSAQLSLGGNKIDFGVKRKKPPTAEVILLNPATYTSGSNVSLQFNLNNFDESKGISVYMQNPCHSSETVVKVSPGVYKVDIGINLSDIDGQCQITLRGLAQNESVTTLISYKQNRVDIAKIAAALHEFINHKNWLATTSSGTSYTLQQASIQDDGLADHAVVAMLRDPKIPVPSMLAVTNPNKVQMTRLGCIMEGTFSGSTATLKRSQMVPASSCPEGDVTLQGK